MANLISTQTIAVALTFAAICLGRVEAVPSQMSHEMSGIVQRIDDQTLAITVIGASRPETFAWNSKDTKFFRDGAPVTIDSLHGGTLVQIRCSILSSVLSLVFIRFPGRPNLPRRPNNGKLKQEHGRSTQFGNDWHKHCVVCGKSVLEGEGYCHMQVEGEMVAICCPLCFETFEKNPRHYLSLRRLRRK